MNWTAEHYKTAEISETIRGVMIVHSFFALFPCLLTVFSHLRFRSENEVSGVPDVRRWRKHQLLGRDASRTRHRLSQAMCCPRAAASEDKELIGYTVFFTPKDLSWRLSRLSRQEFCQKHYPEWLGFRILTSVFVTSALSCSHLPDSQAY